MDRAYDPHSVYGYDPESGLPREKLNTYPPVADEDVTAARAAAVAERYEVLDAKRQAVRP